MKIGCSDGSEDVVSHVKTPSPENPPYKQQKEFIYLFIYLFIYIFAYGHEYIVELCIV